MKAQNKNRKHPTCSRCRFHGKKDIRVLQHQCPFRNCTCSSCFLIKRRSIIYRAQKNLDKTEDNSNESESADITDRGSGDGSVTNNFSEMNGKNGVNCSISRSSDSSSDATNFGNSCFSSDASLASSGVQSWKESEPLAISANSTSTSNPVKSLDHYKISDFQSLCLTFPELTSSQLQSIFEQCGNDFQRTIDRVLMSKWCNDTDCKPNVQFQNNNYCWSTPSDYASNTTPQTFSSQTSSSMTTDGMDSNCYNANNGQNCYEWRSNGGICSSNDDLCSNDYGNDYYYDQSLSSCAVMSTQGNPQTVNSNWNNDYNGYWYSNSQGSHTNSNGSSGSYELGSGSFQLDDTGWSNGHIGNTGSFALGPIPEQNI